MTMVASHRASSYQHQQYSTIDDNDDAVEETPLIQNSSSSSSSSSSSHDDAGVPTAVRSPAQQQIRQNSKRQLPHGSNNTTTNRAFIRCALPLALLVCLTLFVTTTFLPTNAKELELARAYDVSFLNIRKLRSAQLIADSSFLTGQKHKNKVLQKVIRKKKKKHKKSDKHKHNNDDDDLQQAQHHHKDNNSITIPSSCEATVLIIRHCEKGHIREHCAYNGFERSVYLASLFGDAKQDRWPAPHYIFAESPGRRKKMNFREMETVGPLASKVNVTVDTTYSTHTSNHLAANIMTLLQQGEMCGKTVVVSWKHSNIGHLAHRLGCGPAQGCPLDYRGKMFDEAWQLKFVYKSLDHSALKSFYTADEPEWRVFGSVQAEGFDPLAFSKQVGDYPAKGTTTTGTNSNNNNGGGGGGAQWKKATVEVPERKNKRDEKWQKSLPEILGGPREVHDN